MTTLKNMSELTDRSLKQLIFFYELCKMGVVRFDLNKPEHASLLMHIVEKIEKLEDEGKREESEYIKSDISNRRKLMVLIGIQLYKHAIPKKAVDTNEISSI